MYEIELWCKERSRNLEKQLSRERSAAAVRSSADRRLRRMRQIRRRLASVVRSSLPAKRYE